ncbi:cysteine--tRNA ligase [Chelatococcus reniformis]|uniref:Cysteine--tRNA ligase n=1 Tax=Chelatococcus reniformis TaxID=1494448 RepID=A0A916UHY5_9HYPH|nr:cysteine--tRNA ligase [Chelatococcus reniformis]GGC73035.1 cysteine--tRNA ligase [Chelatococcus reniformis]
MSVDPSAGSRAIRLHNTLTRTKDAFHPVDAANVRMYVCGPTVYDDAHIGNARPIIVFDVLFRLLRQIYGAEHVTYVRNITDVDDKINARAAERGITIRALTETTAARFHEDIAALGVLAPTVEPRATDHIAEMVMLIERLVARDVAYVAEDHVLFGVAAMGRLEGVPRYGALSNRSLDEMLAGARVEVAPYKRDPMDFVLWKPSKAGEPGWPSPCGIAADGRPGWHIECSAMSWKHLVDAFAGRLRCEAAEATVFDIHGGGIDLVFPHHEDEIAQTCCALETPRMANYWLHNGFLQVEGQKMSKSLGNFVTIRQLLTTDTFGGRSWPGEVLRLAMLRAHYRQPIDWTVRALEEAEATLMAWHDAAGFGEIVPAAQPPEPMLLALEDDLNTAEAIAALHGLRKTGQLGALKAGLQFLGLLNASRFSPSGSAFDPKADLTPENRRKIEAWIERRAEARAAKNWGESDRIRDELSAAGIVLKDNKDGTTTWDVARGGHR